MPSEHNTTEATVAHPAETILGEGPVWDEARQQLYWVDIVSGTLFVYDPETRSQTERDVGGHLGAVALRETGGLVLAKESGFAFFDLGTGEITPITDPEAHLPDNRFNDAKCSPQGALWAGTLSYDAEEGAGSLYALRPDGSVDVKATGTTISNGLAWNRTRTRFYFVDSGARTVYAFDYDADADGISNRSVMRRFGEEGSPDGMTIDTDDYLWVALYGGGKVIRMDPVSGETVFEVHVSAPHVTSCTFGGPDLDTLYITTARENMSDAALERAPLAGSLFEARVPFNGRPAFRFAG